MSGGRTLNIRGTPFEIVGVMAPSFVGVDPTAAPEIMVPYAAKAQVTLTPFVKDSWAGSGCRVFGRLPPSASEESARAEGELLLRQAILAAPPSEEYDLPRLWLEDLSESSASAEFRRESSVPLIVLLAATGLILIIT